MGAEADLDAVAVEGVDWVASEVEAAAVGAADERGTLADSAVDSSDADFDVAAGGCVNASGAAAVVADADADDADADDAGTALGGGVACAPKEGRSVMADAVEDEAVVFGG